MFIYCERSGAGWGAEPLNAVSSLAFLFAALLVYRRCRGLFLSGGAYRWDLLLIVLLTASVGIGGLLWHTLGTEWAHWVDRTAMLAFINIYLMSFLYRGLRTDGITVVMVVLAFQWLLVTTGDRLSNLLPNGAAFYVAVLVMLGIAGFYAAYREGPRALPFLGAFVAFGAGLGLKAADMALCPLWPPGTHFLWHLLTAVGFYLAILGLVSFIQPHATAFFAAGKT